MNNNNYYQDPKMLTFKANEPLSSIATLTFGSPSPTKDHNDNNQHFPNNKDLSSIISSYNNQLFPSSSLISLTHDSYLITIMHLLYRMPLFKEKICSKSYNPDDTKAKLLIELKSLFLSYDTTKQFKVDTLRHLLSRLFKAQNKFGLTEPDNPIDCYFILINSLHNYSIQAYPNDICSQKCQGCFSHRNIFMDIQRRESCDCGWQCNESFSYLNYIMNIPYERIIDLGKNAKLVEMNKTSKFNSLNFKDDNTNDKDDSTSVCSYVKIKEKLFFYLAQLINGHNDKDKDSNMSIRKICRHCNKSYIKRALFINNIPSCLSFSFSYASTMQGINLKDILSSLIVIPKIFELGQLYDNNHKNKVFYEFFGVVLLRKSMNYSVAIKYPDSTWEYRTEDNTVTCQSWSEVIGICLKEIAMPILMLFQVQDKYSNKEKELDKEDIKTLVKYIDAIDEFREDNIFRTNEGILPIEALKSNKSNQRGSDKVVIKCLIDNPMNEINNNQSQPFKAYTNTNSAIKDNPCKNTKNITSNNSQSNIKNDDVLWYLCLNCGLKNRMENTQCLSCMKNNKDLISKLKSMKKDIHAPKHNDSNSSNREQFKQNYFNKPNPQYNKNSHITKAHKYKEQAINRMNRQSSSKRELNPIAINKPKGKTKEFKRIEISRDASNDSKEQTNEKMIYHRQIKRLFSNPDWRCDICGKYNKPNVFRCYSCKTINSFQRDILEGMHIHKDNQKQSQSYTQTYQSQEIQHKKPQSLSKPKLQTNNNYSTQSRITSKRNTFTQQQTPSTRLNKRQLSVGNIKQRDLNYDSQSSIAIQKASSIKPKRPSTSHCHLNPNPTKDNHNKKSHITEPYNRPKTSQCKIKGNPLT